MTTKEFTDAMRSEIKETGRKLLVLKRQIMAEPATGDKELDSEAIANVVLSFRHIEDAAMRLGKVLQSMNGGVSQYDNSGVVEQK